jgi:very-short-patch-repair endonuclease
MSRDARCAGVAAGQFGLITAAQALEQGMSRDAIVRRVASGRWERVAIGVYRLPGAPASWHQSLMLAVLCAGPRAAASHRAAAALHGLGSFRPGPVEVTAPRIVRRDPGPAARFHFARRLGPCDVECRDRIPTTTPPRTLVDLAGVVSASRLEGALDDALRRKLCTPNDVLDAITRAGTRRRGTGALRGLVAPRLDGERPTESELELRLLQLLRRARLPVPVAQHEIDEGGFLARADFAYPAERVALEAHGARYHVGRVEWQRDLHRANALQAVGWHVLAFTWDDVVTRPSYVVAEVAKALERRR